MRTVEATLLPRGAPASAFPDAEEVKHPARAALEKLGCTRSEARRRVERALERRGDQEELSVGDLVKEALRL